MEMKIPPELRSKIEGNKLIHKIHTEMGFEVHHEAGKSLTLIHDDKELLKVASDTLEFWTAPQTRMKDFMLCLLENKKVVWKFHGNQARKVMHLFEENLKTIRRVEVRKDNTLTKNISLLEILCEFEEYKRVNPKMEQICKGLDELLTGSIKLKERDRLKARKYVENKLENDRSVLCIFDEKQLTLEIFAKNNENIAKVKAEFCQQASRLDSTENPSKVGSSSKTTVIYVNAKDTQTLRTSIIEQKLNGKEESIKDKCFTNDGKDDATKALQVLAETEQKDLRTDKNFTKSTKTPDENNIKGLSLAEKANNTFAEPAREFSDTNRTFGGVVTKQYPPVLAAESRFRYDFVLNELKILVYKESIVDVKGVDVIVNAANEHMAHVGGVAYYISKGAGKTVDDESRAHVAKYGRVQVGKNCVTSAGNLPYSGIIHAVGPQWADYVGKEQLCAQDLYLTVTNTLKTAKENKWRRIALCAISAGIYGVPKELCAEMYVKALVDFSQEYAGSLAEVHFVDVNLEILGFIKDAHGKWLKSPDCLDFQKAKKYPSATGRKPSNSTSYLQRSTFQKSITDSGPVKYIGQSKTAFDRSPVYEFMIHGVLKVQIYTGNLVKLSNVDAIACSVNDRFSGGLANVISQEAGLEYQTEIGKFRRPGKKSSLYDGDVFVCTGGRLRVKKVLHVVIGKTIDSTNGEALSRLQLVNQRILQEANTSMLRRLAMPLIGAGALRTERDIAACGHRLAKDVIEFCKNNRTRLHIEEIHIINQDYGKSVLMVDTFRQLERNMQTVKKASKGTSARNIDKQASGGTSVRDTAKQASGVTSARNIDKQASGGTSVRDLSRSCISSQKQTGEMYSSESKKRFTETKSEKSKRSFMTPLETKKQKCADESCDNYAEWTLMCRHNYCGACSIILKDREQCFKCQMSHADKEEKVDTVSKVKEENLIEEKTAEEETNTAVGKTEEKNDSCPVCLCDFTNPTALPCDHLLCKACLDQVKKHKPCCPVCNRAFGTVTGTQPKDGHMQHRETRAILPGFKSYSTIEIFYDFPDGIQGTEHPKPGKRYKGTQRKAFLPNNKEGKTVLKLLEIAFNRRLTFTIGESRTTGKEDQVTWNDIHHKTSVVGGAQKFGFPDPDYLSRVRDELAAKGITEEDIR